MSNKYQCYKGTEDRFGAKLHNWQWVEEQIRQTCRDFGFSEIKTPTFEYTEVFKRGVGDTTDIVQKEMFSFEDRGGRSLTLKPELTAGVARAYVQHGMRQMPMPVKLFYIEPCFRAERPQSGRDIEFFQFGVEHIGSASPFADAEVISVAWELLQRLGVKDVKLHINSIGCPDCRERYNEALKLFISSNFEKLCPTCKERFGRNALRVLDCKNPSCAEIISGAPLISKSLDEECTGHFNSVKSALNALGIPFTHDERLVRGLDYYTKTVFEFIPEGASSQGTIAGGGRYDNLIESFGGEPTCAIGFGMGIGRLVAILEKQNLIPGYNPGTDIFVGSYCPEQAAAAAALTYELRKLGVSAECDAMGRSLKAQMKYADKLNVRYSVIIGEDEIRSGKVKIKNMSTGEQTEAALNAQDIKKLMPDIDTGRCETAGK